LTPTIPQVSRLESAPQTIDGIVTLPSSLWTDAEPLGPLRVKIGARSLSLIFPHEAASAGEVGPLRLIEPTYRGRLRKQPRPEPRRGWGFYDPGTSGFLINAARFRTRLERREPDRELSALSLAFGHWWEVVSDWIGLWTIPRTSHYGSILPADIATTFSTPSGLMRYGWGGTVSVTVTSGGSLPKASTEQVRAAFRLASRNQEISAVHAFMQRARVDHSAGRRRQAVIDACSAAEQAMSQRFTRAMAVRRVPTETIDTSLSQANGIVGLCQLVISTGTRLPASLRRVSDQLAGTRNRAVHDGYEPSEAESVKAITTARELILSVMPIPTPASAIADAGRMRAVDPAPHLHHERQS
jgi:hypothetical protein